MRRECWCKHLLLFSTTMSQSSSTSQVFSTHLHSLVVVWSHSVSLVWWSCDSLDLTYEGAEFDLESSGLHSACITTGMASHMTYSPVWIQSPHSPPPIAWKGSHSMTFKIHTTWTFLVFADSCETRFKQLGLHVDHFWKWLCNSVAEVSNQSDHWSEAFNYGLNNVLWYHWCTLFPKWSTKVQDGGLWDYGWPYTTT